MSFWLGIVCRILEIYGLLPRVTRSIQSFPCLRLPQLVLNCGAVGRGLWTNPDAIFLSLVRSKHHAPPNPEANFRNFASIIVNFPCGLMSMD